MRLHLLLVTTLSAALLAAGPGHAEEEPAEQPPEFTTVVAGGNQYGDGLPGTRAALNRPRGVALGPDGLYVADFWNHMLRRIDDDGVIHRVAGSRDRRDAFSGDGGPAIDAELNRVSGVDVDAAGNLYLADTGNNRIRRVDAETGIITTVAGDGERTSAGDGGQATAASISFPYDVAVADDGTFYIGEFDGRRVREVTPDGTISTLTGQGRIPGSSLLPDVGVPPATVQTGQISALHVSPAGDLYISDYSNCVLLKVDAADGLLYRVAGGDDCGFAGDGGQAVEARLRFPAGIHVEVDGTIYLADMGNSRLRTISPDGVIDTIAGNGTHDCDTAATDPMATGLSFLWGVAVDSDGTSRFTTYANQAVCWHVWDLASDGDLRLLAGNRQQNRAGGSGDPATLLGVNGIRAVVEAPGGGFLFAEETRIWQVDPSGIAQVITGGWMDPYTVGGGHADGPVEEALFDQITDLTFDDDGRLWVVDRGNHAIRVLEDGMVTTVVGTGSRRGDWTQPIDGPADEVPLYFPHGMVFAADGTLYFTETAGSGRLRAVRDGQVETLSGPPGFGGDGGPVTEAGFSQVRGIDIAPDGSLYLADYGNYRIRRVAPDGTVSTVAGDGGSTDRGDGAIAELASVPGPETVAVDAAGNVFVAQAWNGVVRHVSPSGMIARVAGVGQSTFGYDGPALDTPLLSPQGLALGRGGLLVADGRTVRRVTGPVTGWPDPDRLVVCDPLVTDPAGDAGRRTAVLGEGPNQAWLDILEADMVSDDGSMTVSIDVLDLSELALVPGASVGGHASAWVYLFSTEQVPGIIPQQIDYRYLAAVGPATTADVSLTDVVFEYGWAYQPNIASQEIIWLEREGTAAGTFDMDANRITVDAPLAAHGLEMGGTVIYHWLHAGNLTDFPWGTRSVVSSDRAASSRTHVVGRTCPEDWL